MFWMRRGHFYQGEEPETELTPPYLRVEAESPAHPIISHDAAVPSIGLEFAAGSQWFVNPYFMCIYVLYIILIFIIESVFKIYM